MPSEVTARDRKYFAERPRPLPLTARTLRQVIRQGLEKLRHFVTHTLGLFEPMSVPGDLTLTEPKGRLDADQLRICERLDANSVARLEKLEQRATTLLPVVTLVAPLAASAALFVLHRPLPPVVRVLAIVGDVLAMALLLMSVIALLRALSVRASEVIFLGGLIDKDRDAWRPYEMDYVGRGLIYTATMREALCDHIADFVRAAQVFLWLGIGAELIAGALVLGFLKDRPQRVEGVGRLDRTTVSALSATVPIRSLATKLDSLISEEARIRGELRDLRFHIDTLQTGRRCVARRP